MKFRHWVGPIKVIHCIFKVYCVNIFETATRNIRLKEWELNLIFGIKAKIYSSITKAF